MAKDLRYYLKFDTNGRKLMEELGVSTKQLDEAFSKLGKSSRSAKENLLSMASVSVIVDGVTSAIGSLHSAMADLAGAYSVQIEAETKLQTVMSQRMNATEVQVNSVKELCSAQQELGIIGDEVQLMGAQQLSTFLSQTGALQTLIPAMNNLLAQQKGYKASAGDAVNIGNLMGKVMQGQTAALTRVGITFSETQKKILETGDEMERAATLAQVIKDNVGEMNATLAQTDAGKQKQLENTLGDIKEQVGQCVAGFLPFITIINQTALLTGSLTKLANSLKLVAAAQKVWNLTAETGNKTAHLLRASLYGVGTSAKAAAVGANIAKVAIRGLMVATGVGAAITALTFVLETFCNKADKAADKAGKAKKAMAGLGESGDGRSGVRRLLDWDEGGKHSREEIEEELKQARADLKELKRKANLTLKGKKGGFANQKEVDQANSDAYFLGEHIKHLKAELANLPKTEDISINSPETTPANSAPLTGIIETLEAKISALEAKKKASNNAAYINRITEDINKLKKLLNIYQSGNVQDVADFRVVDGNKPDLGLKLETVPVPIKLDTTPVKEQTAELTEIIDTSFGSLWGNIQGVAGGINSITEALEGNGSAWEKLNGIVSGSLQIFQGIRQIIPMVTAVTNALIPVKQQEAAASTASANAKVSDAAAGVMAAHSSIPFAGIAIAGGMLATMLALMFAVPKFAKGGIAYGPTLGLFGEYSGAGNNPEVVAPLDRLRSLLYPASSGPGKLTATIKGRDLKIIYDNRSEFESMM